MIWLVAPPSHGRANNLGRLWQLAYVKRAYAQAATTGKSGPLTLDELNERIAFESDAMKRFLPAIKRHQHLEQLTRLEVEREARFGIPAPERPTT